jgi:hypothetical protein
MQPRTLLRAEGVAVFGLATAAYLWLDGPLWLYLLLALAPDLGMLGYLAGPRLGSRTYNAVHTYVGPGLLVALATWQAVTPGVLVGLVWAAHIGADRALAYGLKYPTAFKHTHLGGSAAAGSDREVTPGPEPETAD